MDGDVLMPLIMLPFGIVVAWVVIRGLYRL